MLRTCFVSIVLFTACSLNAQNPQKVDSLIQVYKNTSNDTTGIIALQHLVDHYLYKKPDSARYYSQIILARSAQKQFNWGSYNGHLYRATYHWSQSQLDSALQSMTSALDFAKIMNDDGKISHCYARMAMAYSYKGDYAEAKSLTYKALNISKKNNDWEGLYYAYYRLGNVFYYESDFDNAIENYLKVDSIFQHHERKEPALAASLSNIGSIYMEFKNYEKATEYYLKSQELYQEMDREEGVVYINFNLGKMEFNKGNYEQAISIFIPVLKYYADIRNYGEMADIAGWVGASFLKLKDYDKAKIYYNDSYNWATTASSKMMEANALVGLGEISLVSGNSWKTIEQLSEALAIYDNMGITYNKSQILRNLANAYADRNDHKNALNYFVKYQTLEDSLTKVENVKNFQEMEAKYQSEKKEQEIALLSSQNELISQQKNNQRNLLLGGIGLTSIAGIFLFFLFRNRQKTNQKLKEIDSLKSRFFANISHEFRTPLTLISAPLEEKLESSSISKQEREDLEVMQRNSKRLLNLVDQLLDLSKLESGKYRLHIKKGDLGVLLKAIGESFEFKANQNNISYSITINSLTELWYDRDVIEKIAMNLLSNAFKYTKKGGIVKFEAKEAGNFLELGITNTDDSITQESAARLFERFYQNDNHAEGAGVGLSLVKELVELNHGSIQVDKPSADLLHFSLRLPVNKSAFRSAEVDDISHGHQDSSDISEEISAEHKTKSGTETQPDKDADILLVIEDNAEVRQLIKKIFSAQFEVKEAADGNAGLAAALEWVPDVIISDIMMPGIDGLELCKHLKTDERTSHIPVILLTAKAGEEDQYAGLSSGADAYVTKPFTTKLLKTRLNNLVASRKALRDRYSQEVILKPKDIAISSFDEIFLERVQQVLDSKLTESSFSIQEFSEAVSMSRMQLHRKLKALTGLSASEFVRSQRLRLAAALLQKSDANVSEIGYQVGFNDPSYFTKCFREAYGVSPSEFAKN